MMFKSIEEPFGTMLKPDQTKPGEEHYALFTPAGSQEDLYQFDCRHADGEFFSCVKKSLERCRIARDNWLREIGHPEDCLPRYYRITIQGISTIEEEGSKNLTEIREKLPHLFLKPTDSLSDGLIAEVTYETFSCADCLQDILINQEGFEFNRKDEMICPACAAAERNRQANPSHHLTSTVFGASERI